MPTLPAPSRQVTRGTEGPIVNLQWTDVRGFDRLAGMLTGPAGLAGYETVTLNCGTAWLFSDRTGAPGAVFAPTHAPGGGGHRAFLGLVDVDAATQAGGDLAAVVDAWDRAVAGPDHWGRIPRGSDDPNLERRYTRLDEDGVLDGALLVRVDGRVRWVPVPAAGVDLRAHLTAVLAAPDLLGSPVMAELLELLAPAATAAHRADLVLVGPTLARRLLAAWDAHTSAPAGSSGSFADLRFAQLLAMSGRSSSDYQTPSPAAHIGPVPVLFSAATAEHDSIDEATLMTSFGPRMEARRDSVTRPMLAGCPFWIGPQDAERSAAYAQLRAGGLRPERAAEALAVLLPT